MKTEAKKPGKLVVIFWMNGSGLQISRAMLYILKIFFTNLAVCLVVGYEWATAGSFNTLIWPVLMELPE